MIKAKILNGFWQDRQDVNAEVAIYHQWKQLIDSGCIENFRIAAGEKEGIHEGWFFADSDAFKWLDAAARIYGEHPSEKLNAIMDELIELIGHAQQPDGYIYTYNQIHFPDVRWANLQIEHELYCHGHLIEAGVAHHRATGRRDLLDIVCKSADLIVKDFRGKGPEFTPGHQEIELALLKLYEVTQNQDYLDVARQFIEQRGRTRNFSIKLFGQNSSVSQRKTDLKQQKQVFLDAHPDYKLFRLPRDNAAKTPWNAQMRWTINTLTGKYFQQHMPVRKQHVPVGHSVRFAYLETAIAMLARLSGDESYLPAMEQAWERMVTRRMYVTGGIGSLPAIEGFGKDYELDPEVGYAETCAALGSMFWNWEMAKLTSEARYSDLFEWQLYNASGGGMGLDGTTYLYNNPLISRGDVTRQAWYSVPCCPSNVSRTWADLGGYLYAEDEKGLWVHQYVSSIYEGGGLSIKMDAGLPWNGSVRIEVQPKKAAECSLHLRIPSWAQEVKASINGEEQAVPVSETVSREPAASGYDPRASHFWTIRRIWQPGDVIEIDFGMQVQLRRAVPQVKGHAGKAAVTYGPLVYCLESVDQPDVDIFSVTVDADSLAAAYEPGLLGCANVILGKALDGSPLTFIPYQLWGNRGTSQMTVWVNT